MIIRVITVAFLRSARRLPPPRAELPRVLQMPAKAYPASVHNLGRFLGITNLILEGAVPNLFLTRDEMHVLTGRRMKSKQIEALRRMGVPFWVNASGHPVVSVVTVEGRRDPAAAPAPAKVWEMPRRKPE